MDLGRGVFQGNVGGAGVLFGGRDDARARKVLDDTKTTGTLKKEAAGTAVADVDVAQSPYTTTLQKEAAGIASADVNAAQKRNNDIGTLKKEAAGIAVADVNAAQGKPGPYTTTLQKEAAGIAAADVDAAQMQNGVAAGAPKKEARNTAFADVNAAQKQTGSGYAKEDMGSSNASGHKGQPNEVSTVISYP